MKKIFTIFAAVLMAGGMFAQTSVNNINDVYNLSTGDEFTYPGEVTVVFVQGNNMIVTDGTRYLLVYGSTGKTYKAGDIIPAGWGGMRSLYGGVGQCATPIGFQDATTTGTLPEYQVVKTDDALLAGGYKTNNMYLSPVEFKGVTIVASGKNYNVTDEKGTFLCYNQYAVTLPAIEAEKTYNVKGFASCYGTKNEVMIASIEESTAAVDMTFDSEGLRAYRFQKNDSTWYLSWQGKEQSSTTHKLALYRTTNLANKFGHFTTADFDLTESYFSNVEGGEFVTAIDVTLTETEYGFTMSGYVVAADGVTYNLAGEYAAPKATPSVTSFTTLSELDGLTITLSGVEVQLAGQDGAIYLTDESLDVLYGEAHNYTFNNNVLTIEGFVYVAGEMDPLPEEGKDLLIFTEGVISGYYSLPLCTIHFGTSPSALENTTAGVKAVKLIENGQMVILKNGVRYNAVGAQL